MSNPKRAIVAAATAPSAPPDASELSDADLEHVVGGLTRRFVGPMTPYDDDGRGLVIDPRLRP